MFAAHHHLGNLILIIDANKVSMLNYCSEIIDISPIKHKLAAFGWDVFTADGHELGELHQILFKMRQDAHSSLRPKVLVANTIKGHGVPRLETDRLSHIKSLTSTEIDDLIKAGLTHEKL